MRCSSRTPTRPTPTSSPPARTAPIAGTSLTLVTNATRPVIGCDGSWYLCQDAAWFTGASATGPWSLCDAVPAAIYGIPASSPAYGVTFVQVVNSSPDAVTFSYTSGYVNGFALDGVAVYGTGIATPGTAAAVDIGPGAVAPGDGATWGEYAGWPVTYGPQPNFGYAGWMFETAPGWAEDSLQCGPPWCSPGWWGPDQSFGMAYALGMGYAGSWHWGYHPWGARDGAGWWTNHWGAAYRRGWVSAMTAGNRAAMGGDLSAARALTKGADAKGWRITSRGMDFALLP